MGGLWNDRRSGIEFAGRRFDLMVELGQVVAKKWAKHRSAVIRCVSFLDEGTSEATFLSNLGASDTRMLLEMPGLIV